MTATHSSLIRSVPLTAPSKPATGAERCMGVILVDAGRLSPPDAERIAQFHESRLQRSVEMTSRLFEPLLMIFIGLVVGAIVVLMYLPIFDLASSLQ